MTVGFAPGWSVFVVMTGDQCQQMPAEIIFGGARGFPVRSGFERLTKVKGKVDRDERIEAQRDHAEPRRKGPKPQPAWAHQNSPRGVLDYRRPRARLETSEKLVHPAPLLLVDCGIP